MKTGKQSEEKPRGDLKNNLMLFVWKLSIGLMLGFIIVFQFMLQLSFVYGKSMYPTYSTGNLVLANRLYSGIERMDIVTAEIDGKIIIKRVIGLPGETLQIIDGYIYIDCKRIDDVTEVPMSMKNVYYGVRAVTLKDNEYFLIGDNRDHSTDSRDKTVGPIKSEQIIAKVFVLPQKFTP